MSFTVLLGLMGSLPIGLFFLFQLIKMLINNAKFKKFQKKVIDGINLDEVAKKIDYEKLADLVVKKIDEKIKSEVKC